MKRWFNLKIRPIFRLQYRGWDSPKGFVIRYWVIHGWNDWDPFTWTNEQDIQGFRLFGFEWN